MTSTPKDFNGASSDEPADKKEGFEVFCLVVEDGLRMRPSTLKTSLVGL